jgi:hypothetical protein
LDKETGTWAGETDAEFLERAQAYFEEIYDPALKTRSAELEPLITRLSSEEIVPDWEQSRVSSGQTFAYLEFPLITQYHFMMWAEGDPKDKPSIRTQRRLVIRRYEKNGELEMFTSLIIPEAGTNFSSVRDFTLENPKKFSGRVYLFSADGQYYQGKMYKDGEQTGTCMVSETEPAQTGLTRGENYGELCTISYNSLYMLYCLYPWNDQKNPWGCSLNKVVLENMYESYCYLIDPNPPIPDPSPDPDSTGGGGSRPGGSGGYRPAATSNPILWGPDYLTEATSMDGSVPSGAGEYQLIWNPPTGTNWEDYTYEWDFSGDCDGLEYITYSYKKAVVWGAIPRPVVIGVNITHKYSDYHTSAWKSVEITASPQYRNHFRMMFTVFNFDENTAYELWVGSKSVTIEPGGYKNFSMHFDSSPTFMELQVFDGSGYTLDEPAFNWNCYFSTWDNDYAKIAIDIDEGGFKWIQYYPSDIGPNYGYPYNFDWTRGQFKPYFP